MASCCVQAIAGGVGWGLGSAWPGQHSLCVWPVAQAAAPRSRKAGTCIACARAEGLLHPRGAVRCAHEVLCVRVRAGVRASAMCVMLLPVVWCACVHHLRGPPERVCMGASLSQGTCSCAQCRAAKPEGLQRVVRVSTHD